MAEEGNPDTDTSISFLEPLLQDTATEPVTERNISRAFLPNIVDPVFLEYTIVVPRTLEKLLKASETINFIYNIEDGSCILINSTANNVTCKTVFTIPVSSYEEFEFPREIEADLLFVVGKQRYKASQKSTQRKEYLASAKTGTQYAAKDEYKALKWRYLEYQIGTGLNIVYIEDSQDLHREMKAVVSLLNKKHRYTPKIKSHGEDQKEEYFRTMIRAIPGVSESIARAIGERFSSFTELRSALMNNRGEVENLVVCDSSGLNKRIIGDKCCKRLADAFLSNDSGKKV